MKHKISTEKRKWQVALRRYVVEKQPSMEYAPYFGIDIDGFRRWIQAQFPGEIGWEDFGEFWQLEHIIPLQYFDLSSEDDLRLCWHFTNIQVGPTGVGEPRVNPISIIQAKAYFTSLLKTGVNRVTDIVKWLDVHEQKAGPSFRERSISLEPLSQRLKEMENLDAQDLFRINKGLDLNELLAEKKIFQRFN